MPGNICYMFTIASYVKRGRDHKEWYALVGVTSAARPNLEGLTKERKGTSTQPQSVFLFPLILN